jgi:hypothetical protein
VELLQGAKKVKEEKLVPGGETPIYIQNFGDTLTCDCTHTLASIRPEINEIKVK